MANFLPLVQSYGLVADLTTHAMPLIQHVVTTPEGRRIAIEARDHHGVSDRELFQIERILRASQIELDEFVLITSMAPPENRLTAFTEIFSDSPVPCRWVNLEVVPDMLGLPVRINLDDRKTQNRLQIANMSRYFGRSETNRATKRPASFEKYISDAIARFSNVRFRYTGLRRQIDDPALAHMLEIKVPLEDQLQLGRSVDEAVVVFSDIKNFSHITRASNEETLDHLLRFYYTKARELIWRHGGVLDKFIGDGILSIFSYPGVRRNAAADALRFAGELILLGRAVMSELAYEMNEFIETGTRVGVATGPVGVFNIGLGAIELSFLGDTINLSARLQANAGVDCVLMDHVTRNRLLDRQPDFLQQMQPQEVLLDPGDAKGQYHSIRCWAAPVERLAET